MWSSYFVTADGGNLGRDRGLVVVLDQNVKSLHLPEKSSSKQEEHSREMNENKHRVAFGPEGSSRQQPRAA